MEKALRDKVKSALEARLGNTVEITGQEWLSAIDSMNADVNFKMSLGQEVTEEYKIYVMTTYLSMLKRFQPDMNSPSD